MKRILLLFCITPSLFLNAQQSRHRYHLETSRAAQQSTLPISISIQNHKPIIALLKTGYDYFSGKKTWERDVKATLLTTSYHTLKFAQFTDELKLKFAQISRTEWSKCISWISNMEADQVYNLYPFYIYPEFREFLKTLPNYEAKITAFEESFHQRSPYEQVLCTVQVLDNTIGMEQTTIISDYLKSESTRLQNKQFRKMYGERIEYIDSNSPETMKQIASTLYAENNAWDKTLDQIVDDGSALNCEAQRIKSITNSLCNTLEVIPNNGSLSEKQFSTKNCLPLLKKGKITSIDALTTYGTNIDHLTTSHLMRSLERVTAIDYAYTTHPAYSSIHPLTTNVARDIWERINLVAQGKINEALSDFSSIHERIIDISKILEYDFEGLNTDQLAMLDREIKDYQTKLFKEITSCKDCSLECKKDCAKKGEHQQQRSLQSQYSRLSKLTDAITKTNENGLTLCHEKFIVRDSAQKILQVHGLRPESFNSFAGTPIQRQIHENLVTVINDYGSLLQAHPNKTLDQLSAIFCLHADLAHTSNKAGSITAAIQFSEFCYRTLDYAEGVVLGIGDGIENTFHSVKNTAEGIYGALRDPITTANSIGNFVARTGEFFADVCKNSVDMEELHSTLSKQDFDKVLQDRKASIIENSYRFQSIADALKQAYKDSKKVEGPQKVRALVAFGTEFALTPKVYSKILQGTGKFFGAAAIQAKRFADTISTGTKTEKILATAEGINIKIATQAANILEKTTETAGQKLARTGANTPSKNQIYRTLKKIRTFPTDLSKPIVHNGRKYSIHALERMSKPTKETAKILHDKALAQGLSEGSERYLKAIAQRSISFEEIEEAIIKGVRIAGARSGSWEFVYNNITVITDKLEESIVTAWRK